MQMNPEAEMPSIILVGLSHRTTPIAVREQMSLDACSLPMVTDDLHRFGAEMGALQEVAILSTCNRLEVYATTHMPSLGLSLIKQQLMRQSGLSLEELERHLYVRFGRSAIDHLMRVTSGLDSLILGEAQILGQVSAAYTAAQASGSMGPVLSQLFNRALHCGKRARTETPIGSYTTSISHAAVQLARETLGDLGARRALVIGAGEMAELAATALQQHKVGSIFCINRTQARAERLAMTVGGRALDWSRLDEALAATDLIISATAAPHVVLSADQVAQAMQVRSGRPLLLIDIALPRDIEIAAGALDGVTRFDIDHLRDSIDANLARREAAIPQVESIIENETDAVLEWLSGREVLPTVIELRRHAESIAQQEVARTLHRLLHQEPDSDRIEHEVERLAERIVAKLLHEPTVRLKAKAAGGNGAPYAHILSELFALETSNQPDASAETPAPPLRAAPVNNGHVLQSLAAYQNGAYSHD